MDTFVFCRFYRDCYAMEELAKVVKALRGWDMDVPALRQVASRVHNGTRRFNLQEGLVPSDDRLPWRLMNEVLPETGKGLTDVQMETMLKEYYEVRDWDRDGHPHQ